MKSFFYIFLLFCIIIVACQKEQQFFQTHKPITIRYEFNADTPGTYNFVIRTDTITNTETLYTSNWVKTVIVPGSNTLKDTARLTVFPPGNWTRTDSSATATLKIFIDNLEKSSDTAFISGYDRPTGYTVSATY